MNLRHLPLAFGVGIALFAGVQLLQSCHREQDDEIRFKTMLRQEQLPRQLARWGLSGANSFVARITGYNLIVRYQQEAKLIEANLDDSGYLTWLSIYSPNIDPRLASDPPWLRKARQQSGLYFGRLALTDNEMMVYCRRQDVPRWLALIPCQINNRLDHLAFNIFSRSGEQTTYNLPDGSTTDLAGALRWLNESIDHGSTVAVARQSLLNRRNIIYLLRSKTGEQ
jgi:hypothetical protein